MHRWKFSFRKKRCGAVLIAAFTLMMSVAGGSSVLALIAANKTADIKLLQTNAMRRDNAAEQADAVAQKWLKEVLINGGGSYLQSFNVNAPALTEPVLIMPDNLTAALSAANGHVDIAVFAVDENYADNYDTAAERLGIPSAVPVILLVNNKNKKEQYLLKKYMLITEIATEDGDSNRKYIFAREVSVVKYKDVLSVIISSIQKGYSDDK